MHVAVIVPNWNGRRWLGQCLRALSEQTSPPAEVIVVDNGSSDGSLELVDGLRDARIIKLHRNTGFANAVNVGIEAAQSDAVALLNTDVILEPDWIARTTARLAGDPGLAAVACKMLQMDDPDRIYDTGDFLRRDGACEQRGRFDTDDGRFDTGEEVFAPCAGAALYRRDAVLGVGGFDVRLFSYLEDVELGLRLRLAGWRCWYEPVVALHAGGGSSWQLDPPVEHWVQRNTLLIVAKYFSPRWLPLVVYRQLGWARHALREGKLKAQLTGAVAALRLLGPMLRERREARRHAVVPIDVAIPSRPIRGARRR
jgi:GT2 family glycosyltransferase